MKKLKIYVYAISKNEEKFVKRWFNSVNEADEVFVLDTGSTDNTVKFLKKLGAKVTTKKINPWRFDVARNESLKLVPKDYDICVCMDLDEVISKGWRKKLEMLWKNNVNHLRYNYNWSHDKNGNPKVNFYIEKIHARKDFIWIHPVHEVLKYTGDKEVWKTTDEITVDHYPDDKKSRSSYLPLLELSVKEDPNLRDPYVERALLEYELKNWELVKKYLTNALKINKHTKSYINEPFSFDYTIFDLLSISEFYLGNVDESIKWIDKAIEMDPSNKRLLNNKKIIIEKKNSI